ncbi:MAG: tetratricopeptide repeat protein, partial [bacterium]|nr:tetratricopeptide repeat protein [bacterium]
IPIAAVEGMLEVGFLSEGAQFLDKFLESYSESPEIRVLAAHTWSAISKVQLAAGQLEEAHQSIDKAISLAPSQPNDYWNDYFNLGYHYHKRGQIEKAVEIYQNVLKAKPGFVDGHINLGIMFYSTTQFQKALQTFQLAAQLAPDHPEVLLGLAQSYEQLGHRQKAIQSYQKVLQIEPHNTVAIENLSRLSNPK